ncbi:MAG TPA: branched-chain amino acid ABC transporter substrate-binding protein [Solirubrobacteraceae bacterium]|nr:branched-chain amino acid ABC transporter substrate-binding protein [Solirubrobacteraceae bacterium]
MAGSCVALGLGFAACGDDDDGGGGGGNTVSGSNLTIYSSLPLQGTSRGQSEAVIQGERLALKELAPGNKIGKYTLKYVSLDDSTAQNPGTADEGQTAQNARKAASDKTTIFYLGEFNSGGTKVSLPILNKAGIPQISPSNTYVGLTTDDPGSEPGEPRKYYPTGKRTYARVVPRDTIQGAALVSTMKEDGCKAVTLWNDGSTYGAGLARNIELSAKQGNLPVQDKQRTDKNAPNYRSLASGIQTDCFLWSGVTGENGVQVFKDAASGCPQCKLYGPDGTAEAAFTDPKEGGIPADVGARTKLTVATLGVEDLPSAKPVIDAFRRQGVRNVDPYAIYGYETMALALDALKRAGDDANDREKVIEAMLGTKDRQSVLGTYSIDENGDTTLTDYGLYVIKDGQPTYSKKIVADPALIPKG